LKNIRISWIFVRTALLLNYFGQCAWIIGKDGLPNDPDSFEYKVTHIWSINQSRFFLRF
jgi:KUP system potassium uptake protein